MTKRHALALVLLFCYTVVGLTIYNDYGISWDEPLQRDYGEKVFNYVFNNDDEIRKHPSRYHGPVFQILLVGIERITGAEDLVYEQRHFLTFLFSILGLWCFYKLLLTLRFSRYWAAIGMGFLMVSPRIFAHSFFNCKDAVFMYMFIISMYAIVRFLGKPSVSRTILLALLIGFAIDIRILGSFVPIILVLLWLMRIWGYPPFFKQTIGKMVTMAIVSFVIMLAFWPTLWINPIAEIGNALTKMGDYPWDNPVLFEGEFAKPKSLPWYYLPKWMIITTPIFISAFSVLGLFSWSLDQRNPLWKKVIPLVWLLPFLVILYTGATVYDGWRHVFFLYPALLIFALSGVEMLFGSWQKLPSLKWAPIGLMLFPLMSIVKMHPHQQVYFNPLVMTDAWKNYEMEYWGLSYKEALEFLCEYKPEGPLKLSVANAPGFYNQFTLDKKDQLRIEWVNRDEADFFLSNFRYPNDYFSFTEGNEPYQHALHIIKVEGNPIVGVFDLRED